jgi:hypothetical protein
MVAQTPREQIGAVVSTRLTRLGLSDIRGLRVCWAMGFTFVGNGTNGTANSVYLETASSTYLVKGLAANVSGYAPVADSDTDLGQGFLRDVLKHFARKVIKRMWIHVDSLQPSTANNMMAAIGVSRGPTGTTQSTPLSLATASVTANTVANVLSMKGAFTVDSWESKCVEITEFIAGGAGAKQNEFEIGATGPTSGTGIYSTNGSGVASGVDGVGLIPACIAVAGNSTTSGLQNTQVHQISIEQEVDLLDFIGGMVQPEPEA